MGYRAGWFAFEDTAVEHTALEETASLLGHTLGAPIEGYPETSAIGKFGTWTIVFDRELLVPDDKLQELSAERSIVAHESFDTVMTARTLRWDDGELSWSAGVSTMAVTDDEGVITQHLDAKKDKALRRAYDKAPSRAYDDVAEMAAEIVGFRHDRTFPSGLQFVELIDTRPQPQLHVDQIAQWLLDRGFEAKDPTADRKTDRLFRRHVRGDFWLVVNLWRERRKPVETWLNLRLGIHHEGAAAVAVEWSKRFRKDSQVDPFSTLVFILPEDLEMTRPADGNGKRVEGFSAFTGWLQDLIDLATTYCTDTGLSRLSPDSRGLNLEAAVGWSDRSESFLRLAQFVESINTRTSYKCHPDFYDWVKSSSAHRVERIRVKRTLADLGEQFAADEQLSGPELAKLQRKVASTDELIDALEFEHWVLVFSFEDALPEILLHIVRHHLFVSELELIAGDVAALPLDIQRELVVHPGVNVANRLSQSSTLYPEIQVQLAKKGLPGVGLYPDLVPEAQRILAVSPVAFDLAKNPALLPELQPDMAESDDDYIRAGIAENPNVLPELLEKLVKDRKGAVKESTARNPSLPEHLQLVLAEKKHMSIFLGRNPNLAESVQRRIAERGELRYIGANPGLALDLIEQLAASDDQGDRASVTENPALPREIQVQLAADKHEWVRNRLAWSPITDQDIRADLMNDKDDGVAHIARNRAKELGEI